MIFLHNVVPRGWLKHCYLGDISDAFLQGADLKGEVMYMRQPGQRLPNLVPGQVLRLRKAVYGRPDAPRKRFEEMARVLEQEFSFVKSAVAPAMISSRNQKGVLI